MCCLWSFSLSLLIRHSWFSWRRRRRKSLPSQFSLPLRTKCRPGGHHHDHRFPRLPAHSLYPRCWFLVGCIDVLCCSLPGPPEKARQRNQLVHSCAPNTPLWTLPVPTHSQALELLDLRSRIIRSSPSISSRFSLPRPPHRHTPDRLDLSSKLPCLRRTNVYSATQSSSPHVNSARHNNHVRSNGIAHHCYLQRCVTISGRRLDQKVSFAIYQVHWTLANLGSYSLCRIRILIPPQRLFIFLPPYLGWKLKKHARVRFCCKGEKICSVRR